jgi:hypothetical protein
MGDRGDERAETWPSLPLEGWSDTLATLHMWLQIVGKIRLTLSPPLNHCWNCTLYVTARGLTTSPIPYGGRTFQIDFDFLDHALRVLTDGGAAGVVPLRPQSVAAFYRALWKELGRLGIDVQIRKKPNEVAEPIPFDQDERHAAYDADAAQRFWRILEQSERVFQRFRARYLGKCSPVHLFWGAPDLAVTRFSGRPAPMHPGGIPNLPDKVTRNAYSHEVSSCGFWPGGGPVPYPAYYAYAYPEPEGFAQSPLAPPTAFYSTDLHEFVLPYDAVRSAGSPDDTLLEFLQSTYEAAANRAGWDRKALERA